ncbi:hypothetical protein PanWU01x14_348320 [Parasponia andersonii]|uniref:Uncharacterized protein n=1 Tax=Parasponia andersonii TaxID=3476 RepID=A0A2P5ABP8_PARAD|nr:hypothetical protein PanWU01x14_348320 [Parasponia andersonii]
MSPIIVENLNAFAFKTHKSSIVYLELRLAAGGENIDNRFVRSWCVSSGLSWSWSTGAAVCRSGWCRRSGVSRALVGTSAQRSSMELAEWARCYA